MWKSFQIAKAFGIPVKLHWSFFLLFVLVGYNAVSEGFSQTETLQLLLLTLSVFACVVFHEYGHALMARKFGVNTRDIILSPIGGVARLERLPEKPMQEFWVAIAGPLVNVVIALLCLPYFLFHPLEELFLLSDIVEPFEDFVFFIPMLMGINIMLVLFNMIPAFPMDGGRVLRSLLSLKTSRVKATNIAARIGQVAGIGMIGLTYYLGAGFTTALIGLFVFLMAGQENRMVQYQAMLDQLKGLTALDITRTQFTRLYSHHSIDTAVAQLKMGLEQHFLVFDLNDHLFGVLTEQFSMKAFKSKPLEGTIKEHTQPIPVFIKAHQDLAQVLRLMNQYRIPLLPVLDETDQLIGVIDYERIRRLAGG